MSAPRKLIVAGVVVVGAVAAGIYGYLQRPAGPPQFQGWIESQLVFVSPDESGRLEALAVREGDVLTIGAPLFTLDDELQKAAVAENEAAVVNAKLTYQRTKDLLAKAVSSQKAFDDAEAALRSAEARLNSARTRLERRRVASPVAGTVQEVYFRAGEIVSPERPIISVLPPGGVRVRFFVPQAHLPLVHIDDRIAVSCDGCPPNLFAKVNFISAQAEFTPPVIYSLEERARLVFRIEALPEKPELFRVGQPVSISFVTTPRTADASR